MIYLTAVYNYKATNKWDGFIIDYPNIKVCDAITLEDARFVMCNLVQEEMFFIYKNLNTWSIAKEHINYLPEN